MLGVRRTDGNLMLLYATYIAALSTGNVLNNNYMFLLGYTMPASVLAYPITLLVADVICELWTQEDAARVVLLGLAEKFIGIILLGLSTLINIFPRYGAGRNSGVSWATRSGRCPATWCCGGTSVSGLAPSSPSPLRNS